MAAMSREDKYRLILKTGIGRSGINNEGSLIMDAVRKQIPIKPRIETTKEVPRTHNYGRLLYFYCPTCGRFIVGIYETDPIRGGGIHPQLNTKAHQHHKIPVLGGQAGNDHTTAQTQ